MSEFEQWRFKTQDDLTLVADVGGPPDAPAVILLHGGGQTRHSWSGAMRRLLGEGYRVVNYDSRGHGDSDWSPVGDYSLDAITADLKSVVAATPGPVALVGASMGGLASFYAVGTSEPPLAEALVLVDVAVRPEMKGARKIYDFMAARPDGFETLEEVADAVAAYNPDRPRPRDTSGLLKNLRQREDGRYHWHWDPQMLNIKPTDGPPDFTAPMMAVRHRVLQVPTLLVRGGHSDVITEETVADMQELMPGIEVFVVDGAGHMVAGDRNDAFNEGVVAFLKRRYRPA